MILILKISFGSAIGCVWPKLNRNRGLLKITLYHKNGRKIPGTESKITGKLVRRTTKRWRFYWWRHLLKLHKFHIDGQRFLQTVFDWQLHCCDFLFGGVSKAIYC